MVLHCSTPYAPWTVVEANNKYYARVKVVSTVTRAIEQRLSN
jgi:polyphosphate kinase 2 (PPK2 family)